MDRLLRSLAALATRRPKSVIAAAILAAALAALFAWRHMRLETDLTRFLPDSPAVRALAEARKLAKEPGTLYALFTCDDAAQGEPGERLLAYADAWARELRESKLVASAEYEIPPIYEKFTRAILARGGFLYLEGEDLEEALGKLDDAAIRAEVASAAARMRSAAPVQLARLTAGDPLGLIRIFSRRLTRGLGPFQIDALSGALLARDRRALLAKVVGTGAPGDMAYARRLMGALAAAEARGRAAAQGVAAAYTGGYAIAIEDERSIKRDVYLTVSSSVVTVIGIFVLAFRRGRAFVYASAPLAIGLPIGFAVFVAIRRDVTVASAAFVSVVVGLAVDFPIHLLTRYLHARRAGRGVAEANEAAVASAGSGALAAGLMTGAAFLCLAATGFRGLADLGVMAAAGMLGVLLATLAVFPALTAAIGAREETRGVTGFGLAGLWRLVTTRPRAVAAAGALASVGAVAALALGPGPPVLLETNLRNLRPREARALEVQDEIARRFAGSFDVALAVFHAKDEEEALEALARTRARLDSLRERGRVAGYESPERYLPARAGQEAALARLRAVDPDRVERTLRTALAAAGFRLAAFEGAIATLREELRPPAPVTRATLEAAGLGALLDPLVLSEGRAAALVTVFPRDQLWSEAERAAFQRDLTAAALAAAPPAEVEITGLFAVLDTLVHRLERDFAVATTASLALVFLIALGHFRSARDAALAAAPVAVGLLWMLAIMKIAAIPVNFMNVIVFPMVIGIEDNSLHILHRARERRRAGLTGGVAAVLEETGLALFLCTATTMLGFGSLVLSANRGLASIGAVTLIAKTTCWAASTVLLPAVLAWSEGSGQVPLSRSP